MRATRGALPEIEIETGRDHVPVPVPGIWRDLEPVPDLDLDLEQVARTRRTTGRAIRERSWI